MKKLIMALLAVAMLASLAQAGITGAIVVSPRNITVLASNNSSDWYRSTGYTGDYWRDRPDYMFVPGVFYDCFMAQSTYGGPVRTTVTGLVPGKGYQFWIIFSPNFNALNQNPKNNNILAAFDDASPLTTFGFASPWPSTTPLANTAYTGLISRAETASSIWKAYEGALGSTVADASGNVTIRVDYPDGSDRTLWHAIAYTSLDIAYNSPAKNAVNIPIYLSDPANDLVFTVENSADVTAVDVYFATLPDPNLTDPNFISSRRIANKMPVAPGQYTIDLVGELAADLEYDTNYYWKIIGYKLNPATQTYEVSFVGPVSNFKTVPPMPVISISPARLGVFPGQNAVITATAANYDTLLWYRDGVGALSNNSKYSGVTTTTLQISNFQADDAGNYYCVATKAVTGISTASNIVDVYLKRLVAHWNFESTYSVGSDIFTPDVAGGRDAQLMYGATVAAPGADSVMGGYLNLSNPTLVGSNTNPTLGQWALIAPDPNLVNHKALTISTWFRSAYPQHSDSRIFEFSRNSNNYTAMYAGNSSNQPAFVVDANSVIATLRSGKSATLGKWHHLVATVDATLATNQAKLYLDGNLIREANWNGTIAFMLPSSLFIGRSNISSVGFYNGLIDELKIYNYIFSLTDIRRDYLLGAPYICDDATYGSIQAFDFDGNCQVSFGDFAILAQNWLNHARITSIP